MMVYGMACFLVSYDAAHRVYFVHGVSRFTDNYAEGIYTVFVKGPYRICVNNDLLDQLSTFLFAYTKFG